MGLAQIGMLEDKLESIEKGGEQIWRVRVDKDINMDGYMTGQGTGIGKIIDDKRGRKGVGRWKEGCEWRRKRGKKTGS